MAAVDILAAFGYKWAETGTVEALDDAQYKAGWAFIGATPPSVEQFNKVHQIADEKANYLYAQMNAIFTQAGEVPSPGDANSLRDAIAAIYGTGRRFIGVRVIAASGTYTPTPGTTFIVGEGVGGGGAGGGTPSAAAAATAAAGGAAGAWGLFAVSNPTAVAVTIGAGGVGNLNAAGTAGTATSYGAVATFPGGGGAPVAATSTSPVITASGGAASASPSGSALILGSRGAVGTAAGFVLSATSAASGGGGQSPLGAAGGTFAQNGTVATDGSAGAGYGSGGGGAIGINNGATTRGGNGAPGVLIIYEYGNP